MIARVYIAVPFHIALPEGAQFKVYSYEDEGYLVSVYPPGRSDRPTQGDLPDKLRMSGVPAFFANALRIHFKKDAFERKSGSPLDPPEAVLRRAVDSFLTRLRYVTRGAQIQPLLWPNVSWRLRYLTDDEAELSEEPGEVRGHGTIGFRWSWVGVDPEVWEHVYSLPRDFIPPVWDDLRLNALAALPGVGTAVVLAASCLEVFIANILDGLAKLSSVPPDLWHWLNERGDWLREPTTEEQFDALLKLFTHHSLKEQPVLWEAFKNLKTARNTFVHEGQAMIGGKPVAADDAQRLLARTTEIIAWVRQWLPDELKWPEFESKIVFKIEKAIP